MDELEDKLSIATDIIVTGASAGGIGVWMAVDWIAKRYSQAHVTGVSIAGLYYYATYYTGPHATGPSSMADFREQAFPATYALYSYVNKPVPAHFPILQHACCLITRCPILIATSL